MPPGILHHLKNGSFSVRLSPMEWDAVALDGHKMEFMSNYLPFRSSCVENLKKQIFPEREIHANRVGFSHTPTNKEKRRDANIRSMLDAVLSKEMKSPDIIRLWNFLDSKDLTPEQPHDLLIFRHIGQEAYEQYISSTIIGICSTPAPNRRKRLLTFTITRTQKQRIKMVDQERKISQ